MNRMKTTIVASAMLFASQAYGALPSFNNINADQLKTVVEEFGASNAHTSVSGASSLGAVFGIEAGILIGAIQSNGIEEIVNSVNSSGNIEVLAIPHAAVLLSASGPLGLGAEVTFLPDLDLSDVSIERTGFAGKWTLTDGILSLPMIDLMVKAHYTTSKLNFTQPAVDTSPETAVSFEANVLGLDVLVGYDLSLAVIALEAYGSLGYVQVDGTLGATASIFDATITGLEADSDTSGLDFKVGANFKLLLFKVGLEYQNIIGNTRYTAKLSAKF